MNPQSSVLSPQSFPEVLARLLAAVLLVGSGLVHGRLTDRWGTSDALVRAVDRLDRLPRSIGDWEGVDVAIDRRQIDRAEIRGHLARSYRNVVDGREVTVLLVCGRPGPIAVHTPDVCYAAAGYLASSPTGSGTLATSGRGDRFLQARFRKADPLDTEVLDILWAWNAHGVWETPAHPRFAFATEPALFKVYLIAARTGADRPDEPAIDADFAGLILSTLDRVLFSNSAKDSLRKDSLRKDSGLRTQD